MTVAQSMPWFRSNQQSTDLACDYCQENGRHEPWCITQNLQVLGAWQAVLNSARLSLHDELILHALGCSWTDMKRHAHHERKLATAPA